jgi:hypothetical protein
MPFPQTIAYGSGRRLWFGHRILFSTPKGIQWQGNC